MDLNKFKFYHTLKVRFNEVDMQKVVFNANYLVYVDVAITEYFRNALKLNMSEYSETGEFDFVVAKTTLEYKQPATARDTLNIWCRTAKIGTSSFTVEFIITREGEKEILLTAELIYVNRNAKTGRSQRVPDSVRKIIQNYEEHVEV